MGTTAGASLPEDNSHLKSNSTGGPVTNGTGEGKAYHTLATKSDKKTPLPIRVCACSLFVFQNEVFIVKLKKTRFHCPRRLIKMLLCI